MADQVHKEILKTISVLMTTAFAFVAGSAWNEAIQEASKAFYIKHLTMINSL